MEAMPETCGLSGHAKDYESTLQSVADFKMPVFEPGGAIQQGKYQPKGSVWLHEYNPVHVMLRAVHRRDIQLSLDRFTNFVKQQGLYRRPGNPWPPFRIPSLPHCTMTGLNRLLHCRTMHGLLFTLLFKAVNQKTIPESIIYYTIHLLELAICIPSSDGARKKIMIEAKQLDRQFSNWFASDDIFTNISTVISHVVVEEHLLTKMSTDVVLQTDTKLDVDDSDSVDEFVDALLPPASDGPHEGAVGSVVSASLTGQLAVYPLGDETEMLVVARDGLMSRPSDDEGINLALTQQLHPSVPLFRSQGVSANTTSITVNVPVGESILTLLLKLHQRFSASPVFLRSVVGPVSSGSEVDVDLRVGDAEFFVRKVLEKASAVSRDCAEIIDAASRQQEKSMLVDVGAVGSTASKPRDDAEERRKKAKLRQERLMKEFASKQKQFMAKVVGASVAEMEVDGSHSTTVDGATEKLVPTDRQYDCCICSQSTASTSDRLIGLVALLQPTSFLAHRRRFRVPLHLPMSDLMSLHNIGNFQTEFMQRFTTLLGEFDETSCLMSFNVGWRDGVYAQTCGHYLHLDCHKSYLRSLRSHIQSTQGLLISEGEYWCPMCRQLSNSVLPILPDSFTHIDTTSRLVPDTEQSLVRYVADVLLAPPTVQMSSQLGRVLSSVMESLIDSTIPSYRMLVANDSNAGVYTFICSILRTNLELELDQKSGSPCSSTPSSLYLKKPCVPMLYNILNIRSKMLLEKPHAELWSHITGISLSRDSTSQISIYHKDVPLLLKDVSALFIQLVLCMPLTMSKGTFQCIVRSLFNVVVVQFVAAMTCKFSTDEQLAWQLKGQHASCSQLELLMSRVISLFSNSAIYDCDTFDSQFPAICGEVWSPMSIESACVDSVLPFVRLAALLQFHLYGDSLPTLTTEVTTNSVPSLW
jgi:E3 ubiquitin-protein ligase UBR3